MPIETLRLIHMFCVPLNIPGKNIKNQTAALTSIKVSILSISAWARPMMNWFTHAMACDLKRRKGRGGTYYAAFVPRWEAKSAGG